MSQTSDTDFIALQTALAGEYSLDRELGRGGMGIVYLAREVRLARPVAIKVLPPAFAARRELRDAFLRESQLVAGLNHPNIVPVYAAGEAGGFVYIVMAYVEGITLGERIRTRGPLLPGQAARVLREVAWALAYAHGARIVHRDVSAENIMLERAGERAIVMDFGIASAMQSSAVNADGLVMGNAHYVSPEQATGEPVDARSDLYSLGVAGFYALTGRLPFDGETSADVVAQHLTTPAPSITSIAGSVPPRLAAAVERCLHKEPIRRYRNAESFAEAIDLAFEHAKEIPAPLRSWINQGERELPARLAMMGVGTMTGITFAVGFGKPLLFLLPFCALGGLSLVPYVFRLRRVLSDGYHVSDLHAALREHQLARSEEIEYERRQGSPRVRRALRILLGVSGAGTALGAAMLLQYYRTWFGHDGAAMNAMFEMQIQAFLTSFVSLVGLTISGVPLLGEFVRHRLSARLAAESISLWKGKWGARIARLASIGLKPAERPALGMPVLTEIALGRATDHLFHALPKASRKQLSGLPDAVRRLEQDASKLRESIVAFDDQLAAFDRGGDSIVDASREAMADELRRARALTAQRLASTVSALEGIRLDLLRLQMGSVGIESVTASLEAAQRMGVEIALAADAQSEVERILREGAMPDRRALDAPYSPESEHEDDDADTPIEGVPATRG
ncbi:MAG: serine/threonine-protein kinase [Gemmatimonadota bacterium]